MGLITSSGIEARLSAHRWTRTVTPHSKTNATKPSASCATTLAKVCGKAAKGSACEACALQSWAVLKAAGCVEAAEVTWCTSEPPPYPADPGQPYPWGPGGRYPHPDHTCVTPEGPCGACTYPYAPQSDAQNSFHRGAKGVDIMCYGRGQLPVKSAIANAFGVFNRYFTSVPAGSMANHMFLQSGTSCGATNNEIYSRVGGQTVSYPQDTIFDHMNQTLGAESFALYMNNTGARQWPCADANCTGLFDMVSN